MSANGGPRHDDGCVAATANDAVCRCSRHDWLLEEVPRHQARREVLQQLAAWASEQRVFAETEIRNQATPLDGRPGWFRQGVRAAASMASEVYVGVRRTALSLLDELPAAEAPAATEKPVESTVDDTGEDDDAEPGEATEPELAGRFLERFAGRDVITEPVQGALL